MSQGLIVVTTSVSVLGKLINESKAGVLLKERNASEIIENLQFLLLDKNLLSKMSNNAIEYSKNYTLEEWANQIGFHLEKAWKVKLNKI